MTLAKWLQALGCYAVRPCVVTIGARQYEAVHYKQDSTVGDGAPRAGERYTTEALYVLADSLPSSYRRTSKVVFTREGDAHDWYIAGYSPELARTPAEARFLERFAQCYKTDTEEIRSRHQPFGGYFLLHPWQVPTGKRIDAHEDSPYRRVPMTVESRGEEEATALACCYIRCVRAADGLHDKTWAFCADHGALQTASEG